MLIKGSKQPEPSEYTAVILTALPIERRAVCAHLSDVKEEIYNGTVYNHGLFSDNGRTWDVVVVETGIGSHIAAVETERAINHFHPNIVLFVGIAGGLKDVKIGDIVAATHVYDYESGKATSSIFETRPN